MRTYSRQDRISIHDRQPTRKRRKTTLNPDEIWHERDAIENRTEQEACSSTPIVPLSSPPRDSSSVAPPSSRTPTPPSSPPPRRDSPPTTQRRRPLFASLKRKAASYDASTRAPLGERTDNASRLPLPAPPMKKVRLTQTQLDLGGDIRKACKVCGMSYIPSSSEDVALHKRFHTRSVGGAGVDLSKAMVEMLRRGNKVAEKDSGGFVAVVGRKNTLGVRKKVESVLDVVNREMAAVDTEEGALWSTISTTSRTADGCTRRTEDVPAKRRCDRFKVLLYIRNQKCVGLCLAERIIRAFAVVGPVERAEQATLDTPPSPGRIPISLSNIADDALLGISRIWTATAERKAGVATALLDCAAESFLYGMRIPKDMVAFSQPTESGGRLARKWFGQPYGWHVYREEVGKSFVPDRE